MSNKTQLQQNNTELQAHLQDILGLPTAAEIAAGASTGQYGWKKYEYVPADTVTNPSFTVGFAAYQTVHPITDENFDLTKVGENWKEFFNGFSSGGNKFTLSDNTLSFSSKNFIAFDPINKTFTTDDSWKTGSPVNFSYNGIKIFTEEKKEFISFVVSDDEAPYPDGGVQNGYWYERIDKLQKGLNILERREDGSASKICLNYDGETLDKDNGLGEGAGSYAICAAEEVTIIADTLRNSGSSFSIGFYISFRERCKKAKLKIKDTLDVGGSSVTIQYAKKLWVSNMTSITVGSGTYRYGLGSSKTETIYAEPSSKPSGWDSRWNYYGTSSYNTVVWGVSEEQFDAM